MIIEVFQRVDGNWSFRRIAMLGVLEDAGGYASREEAVAAANAQYPGETVSFPEEEADG